MQIISLKRTVYYCKLFLMLIGIFFCTVNHAELRDPTAPPPNLNLSAPISPNLFTLKAIIIAKDRKIAIINDMEKKVGDEVLGEYVTAIGEKSVQLNGPGGKITLFLFGQPIKSSERMGCEGKWNLCRDVVN